jgi:hypothetical protein
MYPSGKWAGYWEQKEFGRQPMTAFSLRFASGRVTGEGRDVIGPFTFSGSYDEKTGQLQLVKQYIGRHRVLYLGQPAGEGIIQGSWRIGEYHSGLFLMRPLEQHKATGDEPIDVIE